MRLSVSGRREIGASELQQRSGQDQVWSTGVEMRELHKAWRLWHRWTESNEQRGGRERGPRAPWQSLRENDQFWVQLPSDCSRLCPLSCRQLCLSEDIIPRDGLCLCVCQNLWERQTCIFVIGWKRAENGSGIPNRLKHMFSLWKCQVGGQHYVVPRTWVRVIPGHRCRNKPLRTPRCGSQIN